MNILAIGAHPDDVEYGCCGTLLKHSRRGDRVSILVLSMGERSGDKELRKKEIEQSSKLIGAQLSIFNFPDTNIPQNHSVIEKIEEVVRKTMPDRVYIHSINDIHQDHRNVAYTSLVATRSVPEIFSFESPSLYLNFKPDYYVDITNFIEQKTKILDLFITQNGKDFMKINAIQGLAQFRGLSSSVKYAEAFEIIRILKTADNV
jgi:LmbE family N-acetylglucosaminyl deacetylase